MTKKKLGLYVHFPFCVRKCAYCDFTSFPGREAAFSDYADALLREAEAKRCDRYEISTLYLGGGTPSVFPAGEMDRVLKGLRAAFAFAPDAECTCECNPGTVTEDFLCMLRENGVNRLSFGVQARQDRLLRLLGRIHVWDDAVRSVETARKCGFGNINLDIMLGLPEQSVQDVRETLEAALSLRPTHMSCYGLIVEEGTPLEKQVQSGAWTLPDEETERGEYELCRQMLAENGFEQYEISNFALPGFSCRHNCDCWQRKEYLGLGVAACGFTGNLRVRNPVTLEGYFSGEAAEETLLTPEDERFESVMLGLRMMRGVKESEFREMHGAGLWQVYGEKLRKPLREGLVTWDGETLKLTRRGMDVQNSVLVELL